MNRLTDEQRAKRKIEVAKYILEWHIKRRASLAVESPNKIQCQICGLWYRQVGTHIVQVHKMLAIDYRKEYGFDVKRGQLPDDLRRLKDEYVFENGTVDNLKKGKKYWFKKGDHQAGRYQRSLQTLERLKLHGREK
jgi:hypothetical protein